MTYGKTNPTPVGKLDGDNSDIRSGRREEGGTKGDDTKTRHDWERKDILGGTT